MSEAKTTPKQSEGAMPDDLQRAAEQTLNIDIGALQSLSFVEQNALYRVVANLHDSLAASLCQPRFNVGDDYNAAGALVEILYDFMGWYREAIVSSGRHNPAESHDEIKYRALLLLQYESDMLDDIGQCAEIATRALCQIAVRGAP